MSKRGSKKRKQAGMSYWDSKLGAWVDDKGKVISQGATSAPVVNAMTRTATHSAAQFKLIVPRHVMDKISWWMHKKNHEVSGFGSLAFDEKTNTFTVQDAILLKQKVGPASAEIDPAAMGKAMFRMKDNPMGLKWHWHSHVNMGVFWSGDDMEIIRSLGQRSWILATVFNYKEERKTAYLTQVPFIDPAGVTKPHDIFVDDIPTDIINYVPQELYAAWDKEYADHVEDAWKSYAPAGGYSGYKTPYELRKEMEAAADRETDPIPKNKVLRYVGKYDVNGYGQAFGWAGGDLIYNPLFDSQLVTEKEKLDEITELKPDEIEFLMEASHGFRELLRKYHVRANDLIKDKKSVDSKAIDLRPGTGDDDTDAYTPKLPGYTPPEYTDPYEQYSID